jgi:hypothetical protein
LTAFWPTPFRPTAFWKVLLSYFAHAHQPVLHLDLDALAVAHREFVDRVVDRFLEQHVDTVLGVGAVAEPANIHAGTQPDVLGGG